MNCPLDQTQLTISDRQGIEIDFCPTCRGVWLDRGELDKLIERSANFAPVRQEEHHGERRQERPHYNNDEYRDGHHGQQHHKKESFLGDIFDF